MPDEDLISIETGRYVNVQSMIFKFIYERSPLFTEQVLVIPIILVFFGEFDGLNRCCSDFPIIPIYQISMPSLAPSSH